MAEVNNFKYPDFSNWGVPFPKFEFTDTQSPNTSVWENFETFNNTSSVPFINMDFPILPFPKFEVTSFINISFPPLPMFPPIWDFSMTNTTLPPLPIFTPYYNPQPLSPPIEQKNQETKSKEEVADKTDDKKDKKTEHFVPKTKDVKINSKLNVKSEEIQPNYYIKKLSGVDIQGLKPYMKDKLVALDKKAKELGYELVVSSAHRSHDQQVSLKRRKPGLAASPYKSAHEYGAAIDIGLYKNGKQVSVDKVHGFGEYAESIGLTWGARWRNQREPWHFNMNEWKDIADISDEYRRLNRLG